MRSVLWSLVLAAGALGLTLATPVQAQAQKDELVGSAITNGDVLPVAHHWHGGWYGRGFYPGGYGFYRGYYPGFYYRGYYPYGGFYRHYYYGGWGYPYYRGYWGWPYYGGYYW
jgi:hypothetical protein